MSLRPPRPTHSYTIRGAWLERAADAACNTIQRLWPGIALSLVFGLWGLAMTLDGNEQLRAEALAAEAKAASTAAYAQGTVVSVTLHGRRDEVQRMAGQFAAVAGEGAP